MFRTLVVALSLVFSLEAPVAVAQEAPAAALRLVHQPPLRAVPGTPLSILVGYRGASPEVSLTLRVQRPATTAFHSIPFGTAGPNRFRGVIPAADVRGVKVAYYIEIRDGDRLLLLGAPDELLTIPLFDPLERAGLGARPWIGLALAGVLMLGAAHHLSQRERQRRNALAERRFWLRTLYPLTPLSGQNAVAAVARLCATPLKHPVVGPTTFPRSEIIRRLPEVRNLVHLIDQAFWLDTLSGLLNKAGPPLARDLARLSRTMLSHPLDGFHRYSTSDLLNKLEDLRQLDHDRFWRDVVKARFPGCDLDMLVRSRLGR